MRNWNTVLVDGQAIIFRKKHSLISLNCSVYIRYGIYEANVWKGGVMVFELD